jgi:hypothetical protein
MVYTKARLTSIEGSLQVVQHDPCATPFAGTAVLQFEFAAASHGGYDKTALVRCVRIVSVTAAVIYSTIGHIMLSQQLHNCHFSCCVSAASQDYAGWCSICTRYWMPENFHCMHASSLCMFQRTLSVCGIICKVQNTPNFPLGAARHLYVLLHALYIACEYKQSCLDPSSLEYPVQSLQTAMRICSMVCMDGYAHGHPGSLGPGIWMKKTWRW